MVTDPLLEIRSISKAFGNLQALDSIDLKVDKGSLIVLLGPAGAGKTTLLRCIAGLENPDAGDVLINGDEVTKWQPNQRDIAMIFDNLALYPNKNGYENIASPLRIAKAPKDQIKSKVDEVAGLLKIEHILDRLPGTFSGGEKQRVALGRAMVREPHFYLLDEPLSSLDFMLRIDLRTELKRLQKELGRTFIFATPDYTEALALADQVVVLMDGKVAQMAPAQELYDKPATKEVARFVGNPAMNVVAAQISGESGDPKLIIGGSSIDLTDSDKTKVPSTKDVEIGLRPTAITLLEGDDSVAAGYAKVSGVVNDLEPLGMHTTVGIEVGGESLVFTVEGVRDYQDGTPISVAIDTSALHYFDPTSGIRL
ncbi:MAG: ABC transporter ATP-binding protein [Alphaproteobacteria bacterium]|nr:ABC transporter ATP-binding protein [Alphaproteobacteria bacterium]|tara:strand:- start:14649 stop:15752 length:1104 start_codon:yes stop_codon:yes gene_type:complete